MPDITPVPDDSSRLKTVLIVSAVGVLVLGAVAFAFWRSVRPEADRKQARKTYEAAQETTADVTPGSVIATASSVGSGTGDAVTPVDGSPETTSPAAASASGEIVFRLGGSLYIAKADGSSPRSLGVSAKGAYVLSPDDATVAVVDSGILTFIDVASGARTRAGRARDVRPVWRPDSSGVVYAKDAGAAGAREMWSVQRNCAGDRVLAPGVDAAISPDGLTVAILPDPEVVGGHIQLVRSGRASGKITAPGTPTAVAVSATRVFVGLVAAGGATSVYEFAHDGGGVRKLLGAPSVDTRASWGSFLLSRDGSRLALAALGDDGYSRLSIASLPSGEEVRVNARRDAYPLCWAPDGSRLYYIEGSAYQGESTTLVAVTADGADRRVVATGASR